MVAVICSATWLCVLPRSASVRAAEFRGGDKVVVEADEVIEDDLYVFGQEVRIDGTVEGDLVAYAAVLYVNGAVEGDLIAAGQTIVIDGTVGDTTRIAGQVLRVGEKGQVTGDLIAAGFSLECAPGSIVLGDLVYGGYQALLAGTISRNVLASMDRLRLAGTVEGDMNLKVSAEPGQAPQSFGPPPPVPFPNIPVGLTITETARVAGKLKYQSPEEADISSDAHVEGPIEYSTPPVRQVRKPGPAEIALGHARRLAALLVIGLVAIVIAPRFTVGLSENARSRPLASFLWGVVAFFAVIGTIVAVLVATIALPILFASATLSELSGVSLAVGILSAIGLIGGFWFFTSYLASIVVSLMVGRLVIRGERANHLGWRVLALVIGLIVLVGLTAIPYYVGLVIAWIVVVLGLGALWMWLFGARPVPGASPTPRLAPQAVAPRATTTPPSTSKG
jgi:cytoskeletal protein CcmA (bactofilin family)